MNQRYFGVSAAVAIIVVLIAMTTTLFTVNQTEQALLLQFGQPRAVITQAGLHAKLPWQHVVYFDRRVLNLDIPQEEVIAEDKKRLVVDAFARWRITDPLRFNQTLTDQDVARVRLQAIVSSNLRRVLGAQNFSAVLSGERAKLMRDIRDGVNTETNDFGIKIVDVRIRRTDLPQANSDAIYARMVQERKREANEFRGQGGQASEEIKSKADRDATVIRAEATRQSEITRGEGDGERSRIYADAYGKDPEFFNFYRSMTAYQAALSKENTSVVLSPDSAFFKYFQQGPGNGK